jgi:hypothetical protein
VLFLRRDETFWTSLFPSVWNFYNLAAPSWEVLGLAFDSLSGDMYKTGMRGRLGGFQVFSSGAEADEDTGWVFVDVAGWLSPFSCAA